MHGEGSGLPVRMSKIKPLAGVLAASFLTLFLHACAGGQSPQQASDASSQDETSGQISAEASQQMPADPSQQMPTEPPADTTGGSPWLDSNIEGNVTEDTTASPADDLYLSVNHDWLVLAEIPQGGTTVSDSWVEEGQKLARKTIAEAELEGHDARQAQSFYKAAADMDARNAAGCKPARATVEDIRSLASIEDISAFLLDAERSAGVPTLIGLRNTPNSERSHYTTWVSVSPETFGSSPGTLGMDAATVEPGSDLYQARLALVNAVLTKVGYSADEAKAAFQNRVELEKRIIEAVEGAHAENANAEDGEPEELSLALSELDEFAGSFPLRELVESRGYATAEKFEIDGAEVRAAASLYTQDNIELLRDYLVCGYALEVGSWLDAQTYGAWAADQVALGQGDTLVMTDPADTEVLAFQLAARFLPTCVGRAFVEGYNLEEPKKCVEELCADAVETHKELIRNSEWLSEPSKQRLVQKLDGITVQAVYPDAWEDYSGLELDGLDYYGVRRAVWLNDRTRNAAHTGAEYDNRLWSNPSLIGLPAVYDPQTNSIRIVASGVEPYVSQYLAGEISLYDLMGGGVGNTIFHEIAHSFGENAIYQGADGRRLEESLLEPADLEE